MFLDRGLIAGHAWNRDHVLQELDRVILRTVDLFENLLACWVRHLRSHLFRSLSGLHLARRRRTAGLSLAQDSLGACG